MEIFGQHLNHSALPSGLDKDLDPAVELPAGSVAIVGDGPALAARERGIV